MAEKKKSSSPMAKSVLVAELAQAAGIEKKQATACLDHLAELAQKQLKSKGVFTIPDVARLKVKDTKARPAREGRNPFTGATIQVKAKPAGKTVRAYVVKALKTSV